MLIAVFFAETNQSYDFRVDGSAPIEQLVEEMVGMIAQRDHLILKREAGLFLLCSRDRGKIFDKSSTLLENGVASGDELMLV